MCEGKHALAASLVPCGNEGGYTLKTNSFVRSNKLEMHSPMELDKRFGLGSFFSGEEKAALSFRHFYESFSNAGPMTHTIFSVPDLLVLLPMFAL